MSSFPSMISNEPPPLEMTSDDDDSEEFRTPGLKLDVVSAEPSPLSTPFKKPPQTSSPGKGQCTKSAEERPDTSSQINGHLSEDLAPSFAVRPPLNCQSSEEGGLKTPGSTSETGPHSTPSSPSELEFSDCQNHEFDYDLSPPGQDQSSPAELNVTETGSPGSDHPARMKLEDNVCDTTVVSGASADDVFIIQDPSQEQKGEVTIPSNHSTDSLDNELNDKVENLSVVPSQSSVEGSGGDRDHLKEHEEDTFEASQSVNLSSSPVKSDVPISQSEFNEEPSNNATQTVEESEEFGDFEAFPASFVSQEPDDSKNNASNSEMKTSYIGEVDEDEDDDGFGDFASIPPSATSVNMTAIPKDTVSSIQSCAQPFEFDDDDDFADFQDFQHVPTNSQVQVEPHPKMPSRSTSFSQSFTSPRASADFSAALESKFDTLIKTVIPQEDSIQPPVQSSREQGPEGNEESGETKTNSPYVSIDKEISGGSDSCWTHVQDFEESKGLLYKWLNSLSQQKMYKSLKIDASNIVYTEKWGAIEVPKFAASMVETPILQPQVFSSPATESVRKSSVPTPDDAPNSGSRKAVSKEARQILQQIPDISFMTAKTLVFPQTSRTSKNSLL